WWRSVRRRRARLAIFLRGFQKRSEFGRGLELRDGIEFLEGRGEGVGEAPHGPGRELLKLRVEVEVVDFARQVLGCVQFLFDERYIYKKPGAGLVNLAALPGS